VDTLSLVALVLAFAIGFATAWLMRNFHWREQLRISQEQLFAVERERNSSVDRVRSVDSQLTLVQRALTDANGKLQLVDEDIVRYADDLKRLDEDLAQSNQQKSDALKQLSQMHAQLAGSGSEMERLKVEQGTQQARLLKLESDVNQRGAQLSESRAQQNDTEQALATQKAARAALEIRVGELERDLKSALDSHNRDLKGWEAKFVEMGALIQRAAKAAPKAQSTAPVQSALLPLEPAKKVSRAPRIAAASLKPSDPN